ncbi:esterase/lipase family protein [Streptomyces chartreusis]|uniref:esterase/lipase family protein n=1 Tax=Streptomyces chartreusis TaxID=1969 RepID=UPI0037BCCB8D
MLAMNDVVVLLPGISGSVLKIGDDAVWGMSAGVFGRALASNGGSIRRLAMSGTDDPGQEYLDDGVREAGLMPDLHLLPGLDWRIDGYGRIDRALRAGFTLTEGQNYFRFPYDWRRDNRAHAHRLARESEAWLREWRERSGHREARLVLVAHSMGGLICRYFLECLQGWRSTRTLISFGTPYAGSLNALDFLVNGYRKKLGPVTLLDLTDAMRTFTAVYQLLPVFRCLDTGADELQRLRDLPLQPGLDQQRFDAATQFHQEIATATTDHLASDYEGTGGYTIRPVVGEFQATRQSARWDDGRLRMLEEWGGSDEGGDGTVPRLSSFPREYFSNQQNVMFADQKHGSLQNDDAVLAQVHGVLRGDAVRPEQYFAAGTKVGIRIDEVHAAGEPHPLAVRCDRDGTDLVAVVTDAGTGRSSAPVQLAAVGGEWRTVDLPALPAGDYRVTVSGGAGVAAVTEIFTVVGPAGPSITPSG